MVSLYEASKKLYDDIMKINQEPIQQYGINKISKKQCSTKPSEIIITGIPESVNDCVDIHKTAILHS